MYNRANVTTRNVVTTATLCGWLFPLAFVCVCLTIDPSIYAQLNEKHESKGCEA